MNDKIFTPVLRYDKMVEEALRSVVSKSLQYVIDKGLPAEHHFYITFVTSFPGVNIPSYLIDQYPEEMTIVLQYQFYGLEVDDKKMAVTLSFNNVPERLEIPLEAITIFADPSVNFALQFQPMDESAGESDDFYEDFVDDGDVPPAARKAKESSKKSTSAKKGKGKSKGKKKKSEEKGKVISLDNFRKKDD